MVGRWANSSKIVLRLLELIEQSGFHAYHMAEHHSTPLGMAGSPSVFLAAAIQRTSKIRIGPLVYVLPLHHPLRLYEEICMLDHLSGGRLTVGVGRGGALIEHQRLGVDPALAPAMYHEAFSVLMRAFETDVVDFRRAFLQLQGLCRADETGAASAPAALVRRAERRRDRMGSTARRERRVAGTGRPRAGDQRSLSRGMEKARTRQCRATGDRNYTAYRRR
jgi:alkanesulfonate monooxygenase SsuD/methylene tetrahydromethanopterin reductase-like flavin-dependent oxidoreductase (luciferase family)